jgi:DNA primase
MKRIFLNYNMNEAQEIKNKIDLVELIKEYVQVKAVGANFQALCPFHQEKTPSFIISPEKQIWRCFGCGKGGDLFNFIMDIEGIDFKEALQLLAPKAGVVLKQQNYQNYSQKKVLLEILKLSAQYFAKNLNQAEAGQSARQYLLDRGLSKQSISDWLLGYSLDSYDDIIKVFQSSKLADKNFSLKDLLLSGLIIEKNQKYYDRFRSRIMFPICDVNGNIIAFTARISPDKEQETKMGKYINSPQTELFDKSKVVFALDKAKQFIREKDLSIFVEGQMDAIVCHQFGFKNVVASSGTAVSIDQLNLLKRYSNNLTFAFDMDKAGQIATDRGIEEALSLDMRVKIIVLGKEYKDPADCLSKNPDDFKKALDNSLDIMEYYYNKTIKDKDLSDLDDKREIVKKMKLMVIKLKSKVDQDYWSKKISQDLDISEETLREEFNNKVGLKDVKQKKDNEPRMVVNNMDKQSRLIELILILIFRFPELLEEASGLLKEEYLINNNLNIFYKNLIIYYNKYSSFEFQHFRDSLKETNEISLADTLSLKGERDYYDLETQSARKELLSSIEELKKIYYQKQIALVEKELKSAEQINDTEKAKQLMNQIAQLLKKIV